MYLLEIEEEAQKIIGETFNIYYLTRLIYDGMNNYFGGSTREEANIIIGLKILIQKIDSLILVQEKHEKTIMNFKYSKK